MLPVFRRFAQQDFPTAPDWLGQFFNPLNTFCETTVLNLNKNLELGTNVQGQKFSTTFLTNSSAVPYGMPTIQFKYTGGGQPNCCIVGRIQRTDGTLITDPVTVTDWFLNLNTNPYTVTIGFIAGLQADTKYNVTFLVI